MRTASVAVALGVTGQGLTPFVILGDFNWRFDRFGEDDLLWREIDDGDLTRLDRCRLPFDREAECNPSFPQPIDFVLSDDRAWQRVDWASFQEITYNQGNQDFECGIASDRCLIAAELTWPKGSAMRQNRTKEQTIERAARCLLFGCERDVRLWWI
jgi:hypothetical protein